MTHSRRITVSTLTTAAALLLAGCSTGSASSGAQGTSSPDVSASASASPTAVAADTDASASTGASQGAGSQSGQGAQEAAPKNNMSGFSTDPQQSKNYPAYGMDQIVSTRVAAHEGYDRIVVEYSGKDPISFHGGYEKNPVAEGSGLPIKVPGDAFIQLTVAGATYPDPASPAKASDILPPNLGGAKAVKGVDVKYPFEGMHEVTIGLDKQRPYRVQVFQNPQRLVIDIAH